MRIRTFYHSGFAAPIGEHVMPMRKFSLVAEKLRSFSDIELVSPEAVTIEHLIRVHSRNYINAIQTGTPRELAESQKFPWSSQLYPSVLLTNGGVLSAASEALDSGFSAALASGFHHSHQERGEGFCTFNGLVIALEDLKRQGRIQNAAILDMDLHYGNGTAFLVKDRPWIQVLSLYGNDYLDNKAYRDVTVRMHIDGPNHHSAALPANCNRTQMFQIMDEHLPKLLQPKPDILLFQAGADPYFEDPFSPLALDHSDLLERDRKVFKFSRFNGIPIAWVLAGGYTSDISKVVQVHVNTFEAWRSVYQCSKDH